MPSDEEKDFHIFMDPIRNDFGLMRKRFMDDLGPRVGPSFIARVTRLECPRWVERYLVPPHAPTVHRASVSRTLPLWGYHTYAMLSHAWLMEHIGENRDQHVLTGFFIRLVADYAYMRDVYGYALQQTDPPAYDVGTWRGAV